MIAATARRRALTLALAILAAVVATPGLGLVPAGVPGLGSLAARPAAAASSGLTMTADARYVVDPAKRRVHVAVTLAATNHRTDTKTRRFFFDRAFLAVQPGTTAFKVASAGAKPAVRVTKRTSTYTLLRIDFGKQLAAGASRTFRLTFDLVDPGGAPTRATRIGTTLVSFGAWGFGSSGTPGGTVTVVFPKGFNVDVDAAELGAAATDANGNVTFATGRLASPLTFFAYFVADRPGAYKETTLQVPLAGRTIPVTLRAWPDDPAWAKRVGALLTKGLPALAKDIGLPWTVDQPLVVSEALSRNTTGFSGRYNPPAGQIEIAYYATTFVVLHEAAHAWFDGSLLADRWASEGFASYYALRAAKAIGEKKVSGDVLTPALEKVRIPLNAWSAPGGDAAPVENAEYAAALALATKIGARAGTAGLTAVWQAIHEGRAAYQPSGPRASLETSAAAPDWRGLLDLLEERTDLAYDDLWTAWVVRPEDAALLADRTAIRVRHTALAASGGAVAPAARRPRRAAGLAVRPGDRAARRRHERARRSRRRDRRRGRRGPDAAVDDADELRGAARVRRRLGRGRRRARGDHGLPPGRRRSSVDRTRSQDRALEQRSECGNRPGGGGVHLGRSPGERRGLGLARRIWTTAAEIGRNRLLAVGGSLAALLVAVWLVIRSLRDRGAAPPPPIPDGPPELTMTGEGGRAAVGSGAPGRDGCSSLAAPSWPSPGRSPRPPPRSPGPRATGSSSRRRRPTRSSRPATSSGSAVDLTARNNKPNVTTGGIITKYFYEGARIAIQPEATKVRATSGGVTPDLDDDPGRRLPGPRGPVPERPVLPPVDDGPDHVRSAGRRAPLGERHPGRDGVRDVRRLGVRRQRQRPGRRPGRVRGRDDRLDRGEDDERRGDDLPGDGITDIARGTSSSTPIARAPSRPTGSTSPAASTSSSGPGPRTRVADAGRRADDEGAARARHGQGLDWPVAADLERVRGPHAAPRGLRRRVLPGEDRIEISEDLDDLTILHEASHAWFNSGLFDGRWINEGLADTFAAGRSTVVGKRRLGARRREPERQGRVRLVDWAHPGRITDDETDARERYGYDAAWTVDELAGGRDRRRGMQHVLAPPSAPRSRTSGGPSRDGQRPERLAAAPRPAREIGGSTTADDVFRRWVVNEAQADAARRAGGRPHARTRRSSRPAATGDAVRRPRPDERLGLRHGDGADGGGDGAPRPARCDRGGRPLGGEPPGRPPGGLRGRHGLARRGEPDRRRRGCCRRGARHGDRGGRRAASAPRHARPRRDDAGADLAAARAAFSAGGPDAGRRAAAVTALIDGRSRSAGGGS